MFCRILWCFVAESLFYAIYAVLSRDLFLSRITRFGVEKIGPKILRKKDKHQVWSIVTVASSCWSGHLNWWDSLTKRRTEKEAALPSSLHPLPSCQDALLQARHARFHQLQSWFQWNFHAWGATVHCWSFRHATCSKNKENQWRKQEMSHRWSGFSSLVGRKTFAQLNILE